MRKKMRFTRFITMLIRSYRVWMGLWHRRRLFHYEDLIRKEQEAALKGDR